MPATRAPPESSDRALNMRISEITNDPFKAQTTNITQQQKELKVKKARIRANKAQAALRKAQQG